jgi:hypothetical protein
MKPRIHIRSQQIKRLVEPKLFFAHRRRFFGISEDSKIKGLLNKYNKFMPYSTKFGTKTEKLNKRRRSC